MITFCKGDSSQVITLALAEGFDYSDKTLYLSYQGAVRAFARVAAGSSVSFSYTSRETASMSLGAYPVLIWLKSASGKVVVVRNASVKLCVTDKPVDVASDSATIYLDVHAGIYDLDAKADKADVDALVGGDVNKSVRTISAEEIAKVVAGAPEAFDTLKEIADWIAGRGADAARLAETVAAMQSTIAGLAAVATSGSYNDLFDKPTIPSAVTVDPALDASSANPVENRAVKAALDGKLSKEDAARGHTEWTFHGDNYEDVYLEQDEYTLLYAPFIAGQRIAEWKPPSAGGTTLLWDVSERTDGGIDAVRFDRLCFPTTADLAAKADKVANATAGDFAALDANGNLVDSGHVASDFAMPADVQLTPVYSQTPAYGEWAYEGLPDGASVLQMQMVDASRWNLVVSYRGYLEGADAEGDANAASLEFGFSDESVGLDATVTATRDRTDVVGYTLGDQTTKPLQPQGDYATAADLAGKADASAVYTKSETDAKLDAKLSVADARAGATGWAWTDQNGDVVTGLPDPVWSNGAWTWAKPAGYEDYALETGGHDYTADSDALYFRHADYGVYTLTASRLRIPTMADVAAKADRTETETALADRPFRSEMGYSAWTVLKVVDGINYGGQPTYSNGVWTYTGDGGEVCTAEASEDAVSLGLTLVGHPSGPDYTAVRYRLPTTEDLAQTGETSALMGFGQTPTRGAKSRSAGAVSSFAVAVGSGLQLQDGVLSSTGVDPSDVYTKSEIDDMIDDLSYAPIAVSAFSVSPSSAEKGSTVASATLSYTLSKAAESATLDGSAVTLSGKTGSIPLTGLLLTSNKTWTLSVTDRGSASESPHSASKSATLGFYWKRHWGAAANATPDAAFILGLASGELASSKGKTFTVNAGSGQYIWYAYPKSWGTATFKVGGFDGGFQLAATVAHVNASGGSAEYYVYRSDNPSLGSTTVVVS